MFPDIRLVISQEKLPTPPLLDAFELLIVGLGLVDQQIPLSIIT